MQKSGPKPASPVAATASNTMLTLGVEFVADIVRRRAELHREQRDEARREFDRIVARLYRRPDLADSDLDRQIAREHLDANLLPATFPRQREARP
jgi:uncharacterized protein (DUF2236 family)